MTGEIYARYPKGPHGGIVGRMICVGEQTGLIFCAVCPDDAHICKFADLIELRELPDYTVQTVEVLGMAFPPPTRIAPPPETETRP